MKHKSKKMGFLVVFLIIMTQELVAQDAIPRTFNFEDDIASGKYNLEGEGYRFVEGIDGKAVAINSKNENSYLASNKISLDTRKDFSIQYWIKTQTTKPIVFMSQKKFDKRSILSQTNPGWVMYSSGGTFSWSLGSGKKRLTYERENGLKMPINDNNWHLITMTYNKENSEVRLYFDGYNKAIYNVDFDFSAKEPFMVGSAASFDDVSQSYSINIVSGQKQLQAVVDEFNRLGLKPLNDEDFLDTIIEPEKMMESKNSKQLKLTKTKISVFMQRRKKLLANPYTVFQNRALTNLKPVSKIYSLRKGKVVINPSIGYHYSLQEKLYPPEFVIDKLTIWEKTIGAKRVLDSYNKLTKTKARKPRGRVKQLTVGVWNIWHGGTHWTIEKNGWDSRRRIVEIIKAKEIDVILIQETYSSGDFIAAELGYYFATTSDWDYRFQGSNISVISRFPIKELKVPDDAEFNNIAVKLAINNDLDIWAMSNWYGMKNFARVSNFHSKIFENSKEVPVLFGGDFNSVPHTDSGKSEASIFLLKHNFTDAYRSMFPDTKKFPGFTHVSGERIDQLYYKGERLRNQYSEVISTWPKGFPSDHYLILSKFELNN